MKFSCVMALLSFSLTSHSQAVAPKDFTSRDYIAVENSTTDLDENWVFEHTARGLPEFSIYSREKSFHKRSESPHHILHPKRLTKRAPVPFEEEVVKALGINDPVFPDQWHLINKAYPGHDVNVKDLWLRGVNGTGITVAIVDDGLDMGSPDLKDQFCAEGSWDFNNNSPIPVPRLSDDYHGTRCAAEVAAKLGNEHCGVGVAYGSKVSGIRILSGQITSEDEAASLLYGMNINDIYSCSWGPPDDGKSLQAPDKLVKRAMVKGVQEGRHGNGSVYVFASGNGGLHGDNCNFDGYTNSIYSITVGAVDFKGLHPPYAEQCSAIMVVTYSSGSGEHIHTADFHSQCTDHHGGTSAAAPLAAGIYALVLQSNPNLTWRDVQAITVHSAVPLNEHDGHWQTTQLGKSYSHKYGYGKIDSAKLVETAENWQNLGPQSWFYSKIQSVEKEFTEGSVQSTVSISDREMDLYNLQNVEHVTVKVNIESQRRGALRVELTSPFGVKSVLAEERRQDNSQDGLRDWTFMSVAHWGETGVGQWMLEVFTQDGVSAKFVDWQLRLFGESKDGSRVVKYDLDEDYSSRVPVRNGTVLSDTDTLTSPSSLSSTTTLSLSATSSLIVLATSSLSSSSTPSVSASSTPSVSASSTPTPVLEPGTYKHTTHSHVMEYLIFLFVLGVAVCIFFLKKTDNRTRRRREEFEFDIIHPDSDDDNQTVASSERQDQQNLYDTYGEAEAEAEGENEDDMFKIDSEDEDRERRTT